MLVEQLAGLAKGEAVKLKQRREELIKEIKAIDAQLQELDRFATENKATAPAAALAAKPAGRRGRPAKGATVVAAKPAAIGAKRGPKPGAKAAKAASAATKATPVAAAPVVDAPAKRRGRPPKAAAIVAKPVVAAKAESAPAAAPQPVKIVPEKGKRGRKPGSKNAPKPVGSTNPKARAGRKGSVVQEINGVKPTYTDMISAVLPTPAEFGYDYWRGVGGIVEAVKSKYKQFIVDDSKIKLSITPIISGMIKAKEVVKMRNTKAKGLEFIYVSPQWFDAKGEVVADKKALLADFVIA